MRESCTVLVVDDEPTIRMSIRARLERLGYELLEAASVVETREALNRHVVDLVILDHALPDGTGIELLGEIRPEHPELAVIMLTAHSSVEGAVAAMKAGATHYAAKPISLDEVAVLVEKGLASTRVHRQLRGLAVERATSDAANLIIGASPQMQEVRNLISRIAASPASTVLVTGESGTGKDLAARAIHAESKRAGHPFLNITCSALPSTLLESELFGHERGAFTDAKQRKIGLIEHANGGTVFLDEIGEMELPLQAKLLRFLEYKTFRRVGGNVDIRADIRVVSATNVDLRDAVKRGTFREDLYYRLAVLMVPIPPLRDREHDVELLASYFIQRFNREFGREVQGLTQEATDLLARHTWPGNVRELRNAIERAVLLTGDRMLVPEDFIMLTRTTVEEPVFKLPAGGVDIRQVERRLVEQALERTGGNRTRAARLLGMNRDQIRYRLDSYKRQERPGTESGG